MAISLSYIPSHITFLVENLGLSIFRMCRVTREHPSLFIVIQKLYYSVSSVCMMMDGGRLSVGRDSLLQRRPSFLSNRDPIDAYW